MTNSVERHSVKTQHIEFFDYIRAPKDGKRLIVKINSNVSEDEIQEGFARLDRTVGELVFKEIDDLVHKLCGDSEAIVRSTAINLSIVTLSKGFFEQPVLSFAEGKNLAL